nr:hypothetical protein [Tanacetum cinerariifolium]
MIRLRVQVLILQKVPPNQRDYSYGGGWKQLVAVSYSQPTQPFIFIGTIFGDFLCNAAIFLQLMYRLVDART